MCWIIHQIVSTDVTFDSTALSQAQGSWLLRDSDPNYDSPYPKPYINGPRQRWREHSSASAMETYAFTATSDISRLAHHNMCPFGLPINYTLHQSGIAVW